MEIVNEQKLYLMQNKLADLKGDVYGLSMKIEKALEERKKIINEAKEMIDEPMYGAKIRKVINNLLIMLGDAPITNKAEDE